MSMITEITQKSLPLREKIFYQLSEECDYFLGRGKLNPKILRAKEVSDQITLMLNLWDSFPDGKKPVWISREKILEYRDKMVFAQKSPLEKLVFLLGKYPGTPVIPIIDDQICLDENRRIVSGLNDTGIEGYLRRWMGGIGDSSITKYFVGNEGLYIYNESDMEGCLNDTAVSAKGQHHINRLATYRALPWKTGIIMKINQEDAKQE